MWSSSLPLSLFSRLSLFSLLFYRIFSVCLALHACAPRASLASLARALRAPAILDRLGRVLASQNPPKIAPRLLQSRFGSVLGPLGRVLDRLGAVLERLGGILGRLGAYLVRLGAILGRLGAILAHLGAILGRLGRVLASQKPPKIAPRRLLRYEKIAVARVWRFRGVIGSTFSTIFQNRAIIENQ